MNVAKVVDKNGKVVGQVIGFWVSKFIAFISYNDGTFETSADERFIKNEYRYEVVKQ